ncbi:MAG: hypothetical protein ACD_39C00370G0003 [uncultured bacterium]|nr:MAG: hypothetical protein ACD_39C00370G0003 [uncultured bacterium]
MRLIVAKVLLDKFKSVFALTRLDFIAYPPCHAESRVITSSNFIDLDIAGVNTLNFKLEILFAGKRRSASRRNVYLLVG